MNPSMNSSFPPLIPVPAEQSKPDVLDEEETIDKFATLFSPPTPRASPDLPSPSSPIFKPQARRIEQFDAPNSPDSEFGSFVSVPPSEDPLASSVSFGSFPGNESSPITDAGPSSSRPSVQHAKTPSLSFFDSFAQEAKAANERNKHDVMDELLIENDPLRWSHRPKPGAKVVQNTNATSGSLLDLDLDFFTPKLESSEPGDDYMSDHHSAQPAHPSGHPSRRANHSSPYPTHKSTLSLPQGPAPPVASTSSVASTPPENTPVGRPSTTVRSPSYQTLSNISSRWMSSLLPTSKSTLSSDPETESPTRIRSQTLPFSSSLSSSVASSFTLPSTIGTHTIHGAPSDSASPFAPHVFVAPSGAPGFKPDRYDWDKGYSRELDRELAEKELLDSGKHANGLSWGSSSQELPRKATPERNLIPGLPPSGSGPHSRSHTPSPLPTPAIGIGGLIEKKTGNLELKGRREATVAVLDVDLAEMIRSQLPALARLPRSWNLLYSLDQHGISLHTLYDKCENQVQARSGSAFATKVGALVVMKDSGDAVFGVYMGDGIRQSRGKGYYGSGESFLWRYFNGNFQVFKWTGKNEYVAHCEPEYLSFGGGDGSYGLYLDDTLFDGSSARCPTFENEPLCSPGAKKGRAVTFECVGLEVWGVGP